MTDERHWWNHDRLPPDEAEQCHQAYWQTFAKDDGPHVLADIGRMVHERFASAGMTPEEAVAQCELFSLLNTIRAKVGIGPAQRLAVVEAEIAIAAKTEMSADEPEDDSTDLTV